MTGLVSVDGTCDHGATSNSSRARSKASNTSISGARSTYLRNLLWDTSVSSRMRSLSTARERCFEDLTRVELAVSGDEANQVHDPLRELADLRGVPLE